MKEKQFTFIFAALITLAACAQPLSGMQVSTSIPTTQITETLTVYLEPSTQTPLPPTQTPMPPTQTPLLPTPTPIPEFSELRVMFDYDKTAPLNLKMGLKKQEGAAAVEYLTYRIINDCEISAILVRPLSPGLYPAVIYLHMGQDNKKQYLGEATRLAERGVVSLLLDSPFLSGCATVNQPRKGYILTVNEIRRGIDFLETLPEVDSKRMGFVGHSFGATWGGILAGVETRIKAYVLMAGYAQVSKKDTPDVPDLDAILYIGHNETAAFLFQFSTKDSFISEEDALQYYNAANEPKKILWYESTHAGLQDAGQEDRLSWLSEQLGFDYP
jgi:dienelactone hydrolase